MQPIPTTTPAGGTATFTVAATGNGMLTYQWYYVFEGPCPTCGEISGATTPTLTFTDVNASTGATYYCIVTNTLGGTTATATSAKVILNVVEPTISAAITAGSAVVANTAGYLASVPTQAGLTYTWTISNGTITAGQGTSQITFTSGSLGQLQITAALSSPTAGTVVGVKNIFVVSALPVVSVFGQSSVLPGALGIVASVPASAGGTYAWTLQNGTATATIAGSPTADVVTYNVAASTGTYQLSVDATDQTGNHGSAMRTLSVVQGTFLKDVHDVAQRSLHTATLLMDGRVLVTGGDAGTPGGVGPGFAPNLGVGTAELFDPVTMTWAVVGSLSTPRDQHTATLLNDGRVLLAGGVDATGTALASIEIYDPSTQSWSSGSPMAEARTLATATLLVDGRVLVAGGANAGGIAVSAEIYDPVANSWSSPIRMMSAHEQHSATRMANGQVLIVGGQPDSTGAEIYNPATNSFQAAAPMPPPSPGGAAPQGAVLLPSGKVLQLPGEIYDPVSNSWQPAVTPPPGSVPGSVTTGFSATTAILLPNGRVLAAGTSSSGFADPQVYDPVMQQWTSTVEPPAVSPVGDSYGTVTALQDGRVLAAGGFTGFRSLSTSALYDPTQNSWSVGAYRPHSGPYAASGVLANGQVLVTGPDSDSDLFNPVTNTWAPAASMSTGREQHTASVLQNGELLVTGGLGAAPLSSAEVYDPTANSWSTTGSMSTPRFQHTATLLGNGMVVVAGGNDMNTSCNCTTFVNSADLFNSATNTFTPTGALVTARYAHTATLVMVGATEMVLVAGGFGGPTSIVQGGGAVLASSELYNPATGKWTATGSMATARMNHTATLLSSGMVLVAGGETGSATTAAAEVYNPASGTWTAVASMNTPRQSQGAAMLSNGKVLIVGGLNDTSSATFGVATAEAYDPVANSWTFSGAMVTPRQYFVLNRLGDGRILLDGGTPNGSGLPEFYK